MGKWLWLLPVFLNLDAYAAGPGFMQEPLWVLISFLVAVFIPIAVGVWILRHLLMQSQYGWAKSLLIAMALLAAQYLLGFVILRCLFPIDSARMLLGSIAQLLISGLAWVMGRAILLKDQAEKAS